jgi:phenylacetate 2-hydroxylase
MLTVPAAEIKSICLSMVSAGLDTVPGNLIMSMGYLSSPHGQEIQARAREEIAKVYPDGDAWEKCLVEEKVGYVTAFVKETLRFWTVIPICLPRVSVRDLDWQGAKIPAGTTFFMVSTDYHSTTLCFLGNGALIREQNAWAADYDATHFQSADAFNPDRYILDKSDSATGTPHYGYGAGSRMCAGSHLANRELYTAFLRIFESLDILPAAKEDDRPVLDALGCNAQPTSLTTDPRPFKVGIRVRDREKLQRLVEESEERTKDI